LARISREIMTERNVTSSPVKWFGSIAAVVAVTSVSVLLDIPVLRQVSGFIFLTSNTMMRR